MKKNLKNSISLLIIISIIILPFSDFVKKANAQSTTEILGGTGSFSTGDGSSTSASGYISGLAPVITQLPGCKSMLSNGIKKLFGKGEDLVTKTTTTFSDEEKIETAKATQINVVDEIVFTKLSETDKVVKETKTLAASTQKSVASMDKNDNCLNAIGKAVIKILIQKITLSTVNWIQGGFQGGPAFVTDYKQFFGDIAKNEVLSFGLEIDDAKKYPFGRDFMIGVANSFNNKFATNAEYSLDTMIKQTNPENSVLAFSADFSRGGWGAWEAMTQIPANNPLGFQLMASNELGARLEGTSQSVAEGIRTGLEQADGFLGDEKCTDPWGVTREEDSAALAAGVKPGDPKTNITTYYIDANGNRTSSPFGADGKTPNQRGSSISPLRRCNKWEYVTPGATIANKINTTLGYKDRALLDAETINDAIAAILDASLAKLSSMLTEKGLAYLDTTNINPYETNDTSLGSMFDVPDPNTGTQFPNPTQWIKDHPGFDIKTGVTQALIDEQLIYLNKLASYNDALKEDIKWIRQLDYCIPGPNPNWERTAYNSINGTGGERKENIGWWETELGSIATSLIDPFGLFSYFGNMEDDIKARADAAKYLGKILNVTITHDQKQIRDRAGIIGVLNNTFESYKFWINNIYFNNGTNLMGQNTSDYMPTVTLEARAMFEKIVGYEGLIKKNVDEITFNKGIIIRLQKFKENIENGTITPAQLDDVSSPEVNEFARLSAYFVSGDDIANITNLQQEAISEKEYVKTDLLEGTFGCETFIYKLSQEKRNLYERYAGRQPYPLEIDHFYAPTWWSGPLIWPSLDEPLDALYITPNHYFRWMPISTKGNPAPNLYSLSNWQNEGFMYGSYYYNNRNGTGDKSNQNCGTRWTHDIALTATNSTGASDEDPMDLPFGEDGSNRCGVILNFERNFGVY